MNIQLRFLRVLLQTCVRHLRLRPPTFKDLEIFPCDNRTYMKIRLVLSWVEGHHVLYYSDAQVLRLFKDHCVRWYPNYYNMILQGHTYQLSKLLAINIQY